MSDTSNNPASGTLTSPNTSPQSSSGTGGATTQKPMTYADVEDTWIQAGGNPQAAAMAAAVADASSGFNPGASRTNPDGTVSIGLWLIPQNGMPPGSTDAVANARAAVQLSNNGTNWQQWCVTWSDNNCGENGGTYLGEGANALASMGQRLTPASYNVIGSSPTGSGTSASSATQPTTSSATSSSSGKTVLVISLVVLAVIAFVLIRRRRAQGGGEPEGGNREPVQGQ